MAETKTDMTIVCCIEAGALEQMTIRMIASLRRFGGAYANAPVIAVTPRWGIPLAKTTLTALEQLNVQHVSFAAEEGYSWNNFMNKPHALVAAEKIAVTSKLCWLDSDILVVGEPTLLLEGGGDFAACAPDKNVGSAGSDDENEPFWLEVLRVFGLDPDSLPWVTTCVEQTPIRWYFNSGVFSFRREIGFSQAFLQDCRALLDARLASHTAGIFFTDQIVMALTAYKLRYTFDVLPHAYNLALGSKSTVPDASELKQAVILHYHDALWSAHWEQTLEVLKENRTDVYDFLVSYGPLRNQRGVVMRAGMKFLQLLRKRELNKHLSECTVM